jgi:putative SOS response-associated peptidase YedK
MCGRANLVTPPEALAEVFELADVPPFGPRYNIAPSEPMLAVRAREAGERQASFLRWGLVRPGSDDPRPLINLRLESAVKGALESTLRQRRCIVPLSGFYEWRRAGKARQPFNIRRKDGGVFGVAGLWERLESHGQEPLETCLVLTTAPNGVVSPIHDRMPVMLDPAWYARWLDPAPRDARELLAGVALLPAELLEAYPVSTLVNRAGVEDPRCLEPARPATLW